MKFYTPIDYPGPSRRMETAHSLQRRSASLYGNDPTSWVGRLPDSRKH